MKLDTIGKNIRKFRLARKLRQEDLAEKTDLTTNYIGMVERGEKIQSQRPGTSAPARRSRSG